jgi:hypothetical protein
MNAKIFGAAVVLAALGGASAASANLLVTYTGTVASGDDVTGVFGTPGADLTGDAFVAQYLIDPTLGNQSSGPIFNQAQGGATLGVASPIISANVTINGTTFDMGGPASFGQVFGRNNGSSESEQIHQYEYNPLIGNIQYSEAITNYIDAANASIPESLNTPFTYTATSQDSTGDTLDLDSFNTQTDVSIDEVRLNLISDSLTVASVPSTPEPSTWVMVLAGFVALGVAARRRTKRSVTLAS